MPTGVRQVSTGRELADRFDLKIVDARTRAVTEGVPDLDALATRHGIPVADLETFPLNSLLVPPRPADAIPAPPHLDTRAPENIDDDDRLDEIDAAPPARPVTIEDLQAMIRRGPTRNQGRP